MNQKPTPDQVAKLPRWAREYLASIERQLEGARDLANAAHGTDMTPIEIDPYRIHAGLRQFLPARTSIRFGLNVGPHLSHVDIRLDEKTQRLVVHATMGSGSRWLDVRPDASNALTIGFSK